MLKPKNPNRLYGSLTPKALNFNPIRGSVNPKCPNSQILNPKPETKKNPKHEALDPQLPKNNINPKPSPTPPPRTPIPSTLPPQTLNYTPSPKQQSRSDPAQRCGHRALESQEGLKILGGFRVAGFALHVLGFRV